MSRQELWHASRTTTRCSLRQRRKTRSNLKLKEQTGNVHENKGPSQKVKESRSRESNARTKSADSLGVFVNSSTLDSSTPRLSKLKEQTVNVHENKGPCQKVTESRSRESNARAKSTGSLGVFVNSSTLDSRLSTLEIEKTNRECR